MREKIDVTMSRRVEREMMETGGKDWNPVWEDGGGG